MKKHLHFVGRISLAIAVLCSIACAQETIQGTNITGFFDAPPNPTVFPVPLTTFTLPNVAACGTWSYCSTTFPPGGVNGGVGWKDNRTSPPLGNAPITNPHNPVALNINLSDLHALTTNTAPIFAHQQLWFSMSGTGTHTTDGVAYPTDGSHLKVGYVSNNQAHSDAMVNQMFALGLKGGIGDWAGGPNTCGTGFTSACGGGAVGRNAAYLKEIISMQNLHPSMKFALMLDNSSYASRCAGDVNEPKCVQGKMDADLAYAQTAFWSQAQYLKDPSTGNPMIFPFMPENQTDSPFAQCTTSAPCNLLSGSHCTTQSSCWTSVWNGVNSYVTSTLGQAVCFVFEQTGGFTHVQSCGAYLWLDANSAKGASITTATQLDYQNGPFISNFLTAAQTTYSTKISMGMAGKGFDAEEAPWKGGNSTITSQQCGQVWLKKFSLMNGKTNLKYIGIGVWDDYEEGSEFETGVANCYAPPTLSVSSLTLTATLHATDATYSSLTTSLDEELYASIDGANFVLLDTKSPATTVTFNLASYAKLNVGQAYQMRVLQKGQPGLENHISAALSVTR